MFRGGEVPAVARHPNFDDELEGRLGAHGTHVASVVFGRHDGPVKGVAPGCRGLLVPVLGERRRTRQLELARAIERAVDAGVHVINISGGQLTRQGEADGWLERAIQFCNRHDVLVVAAAGNDGCECLQVPAAVESVLAVGAMSDEGRPLDFSNWGPAYRSQGILANGQRILGAVPGGGVRRENGTSLATPIVTGVAALLLSLQLERGQRPSPQLVRDALLQGADRCVAGEVADCNRYLVGKLNVGGAQETLWKLTARRTMSKSFANELTESCTCRQASGDVDSAELRRGRV